MNLIKIVLIGAVSTYIFFGIVIYYIQEALIFFPETLSSKHQYRYETPFEERNFYPGEGVVLNAIHFKHENPKGVIYYHHGNAGSLARWGEIGEYFTQFGYDVLIYDYRGYGKSSGKRNMKALYDDSQFIYDQLKKEYSEDQILIYGRSLGSAMATYAASQNQPGKLILETPFYSLTDVAVRHYPIFPHQYLLKYPFPSHRYIGEVTCSILFFHGTEDRVVDFESGQKLYNAVGQKSNAHLVVIEGGDHNNLIDYEAFETNLRSFLE